MFGWGSTNGDTVKLTLAACVAISCDTVAQSELQSGGFYPPATLSRGVPIWRCRGGIILRTSTWERDLTSPTARAPGYGQSYSCDCRAFAGVRASSDQGHLYSPPDRPNKRGHGVAVPPLIRAVDRNSGCTP
ncbi:hypothetical protein GGX14DRAFT_406199 [Mycena pura]|uniref:Uncharacterized protein n=1 Tax=Mycena pura TaxID=153505 RepID=A0AAD6XYG7_9AGAR|nr:hypothetical protein GGX14DRAFT_406199 [Mycena pura]